MEVFFIISFAVLGVYAIDRTVEVDRLRRELKKSHKNDSPKDPKTGRFMSKKKKK